MNAAVRSAALAALLAVLGLLAAGCGGSSGAPGVASLGPSAATTTTGAASTGATSKASGAFAFSRCMRSHGVPNFPDPSAGGGIQITAGSGIDPGSSQFQSAQRSCQDLLPAPKAPSPAQIASIKSQLLKYAACMRTHGVPSFPDPQISTNGRGVAVRIQAGGGGVDPNSPVFQQAQQTCRKDLPGGGKGPVIKGSGPATGGKGSGGGFGIAAG